MRQRIFVIIAGLGLALGLVAGAPHASATGAHVAAPTHQVTVDHATAAVHATAPTHMYDNLAAWTCGATRPNGTWTVAHAVPDYLTSSFVEEWCEAALYGHNPIKWYAVYEFNPPNIYRASDYFVAPGPFGWPEP